MFYVAGTSYTSRRVGTSCAVLVGVSAQGIRRRRGERERREGAERGRGEREGERGKGREERERRKGRERGMGEREGRGTEIESG